MPGYISLDQSQCCSNVNAIWKGGPVKEDKPKESLLLVALYVKRVCNQITFRVNRSRIIG